MNNIMDQLNKTISPELLDSVAQLINEPKENISKTLNNLFPALLSGIIQKGENASSDNIIQQLTHLLEEGRSLFNGFSFDTAMIKDVLTGNGALGQYANKFISLILGDKHNNLTSAIAKLSNVKEESASSLLNLAGTFVMGFLSQKADQDHFSPAALSSVLKSQKENILSALSPNFANLLNISKSEDEVANVQDVIDKTHNRKFPKIIMIVLILLAALFLLKYCHQANTKIEHTSQTATNDNQ